MTKHPRERPSGLAAITSALLLLSAACGQSGGTTCGTGNPGGTGSAAIDPSCGSSNTQPGYYARVSCTLPSPCPQAIYEDPSLSSSGGAPPQFVNVSAARCILQKLR